MVGSDVYRQQILDHYRNPRNYGAIEDATYSHVGENPMCGDEIAMDVVLAEKVAQDGADIYLGEIDIEKTETE